MYVPRSRFSPHNLRKANLLVNGRSVPSRPYTPNFDDSKKEGYQFAREFRALSSIFPHHHSDVGNGIKRSMFADGFTMIPFVITPDYHDAALGLVKEGTVQLELEFRAVTTDVLNVVLYMEYENCVTIGKHGEVSID